MFIFKDALLISAQAVLRNYLRVSWEWCNKLENGITMALLACPLLPPCSQHKRNKGHRGYNPKVPHPNHICSTKTTTRPFCCSAWGILLSVFQHEKYLKRLKTHIIFLLCESNYLTLASAGVNGWHFQHFSPWKEDKRHIRSLMTIQASCKLRSVYKNESG